MNSVSLAVWRDTALILLALEAIVLGSLPAMALYWSLRGLHRLYRWVRPVLFEARLRVWTIQHEVLRVTRAVAAPFVWVQSAVVGLRRALHMLGWR